MSVRKTTEYQMLKEKGLLPTTMDEQNFRSMPRPVSYDEWDGKTTRLDQEGEEQAYETRIGWRPR